MVAIVIYGFRGFAASCLVLLLLLPLGAAEYYRWTDEKGVTHITDNLHNVPPKFRGKVNRVATPENPRVAEPESKPAPRKASIPIERHGQVVVIQATLNNKRPAKFVVDTGASYTLISNALARELALDVGPSAKTLPFQTANGVINAPVTSLESIAVGGMEIRDLATAVHDAVPDPQVAGLLGLNFLSNFRMDIDTQRGVLHLERK
ncbi:MAG TPA: retroviral-like aspartic protease family protein [Candidatus Binatia bacterium]|nr:retroviral-like aspartic protease family protein [Candidatus Binatia bacterium]